MQSYNIVCCDPNHATRANEPGWAEFMGTVSLPDGVSPVGKIDAYMCGICDKAKQNDINNIMEGLIDEAQRVLNLTMQSRFSPSQQQTLTVLYSDAVATAKTNRKNYIQPAIDWMQTILAQYASYKVSVLSAQTVEELGLISFDATDLPAPPSISVTGAILIQD